eukprot:jgi/Tetstr1/457593/TSEL_044161.t1
MRRRRQAAIGITVAVLCRHERLRQKLSSARNPACTALHLTETCLTSNRRALDVAAMASICQQGRSFIPRGPQLSSRRQQGRSSRGASLVVRAESDYYKILGVDRGADKKTIKSAYRQLARKFHPDVNKGSGRGGQVQGDLHAYEVLSDEQKRPDLRPLWAAGAGGGRLAYRGGDPSQPFDIFESSFAIGGGIGGAWGAWAAWAAPRCATAPCGETDERRLVTCETCAARAVKAGTTPRAAGRCAVKASGVRKCARRWAHSTRWRLALTARVAVRLARRANKCQGRRRVRKSKRISLKIPAGVDTGSRLRVRGEGNAGRRGATRDIYVFISVETVDGSVDLKVPPGTQPDTTLLMAKRGVPRLGNSSIRGTTSCT